jgi:hypothetical protein
LADLLCGDRRERHQRGDQEQEGADDDGARAPDDALSTFVLHGVGERDI